MTDIVERLRRFGAVVQGRDPKDYAVPVPAALIIETADEIERLREALRPNDKLLGDIAHRITQVCVGTCCHRTGGRGGPNAHPNCECREVATEIMKIYEARTALGEKE